MSSRRTNDIEALLEWLRSLQITEEASSEYKWTNIEMLSAPAPAAIATSKNIQTEVPKNIVLDLGWFNSDWTKFED